MRWDGLRIAQRRANVVERGLRRGLWRCPEFIEPLFNGEQAALNVATLLGVTAFKGLELLSQSTEILIGTVKSLLQFD